MPLSTEAGSNHSHLDQKTTRELLMGMHDEDRKLTTAIEAALPQIERFINALVPKLKSGGRLFYIGAGTSGRLGVLDASEIPPTFGVENLVIGIIAGGTVALQKAVENAEDNRNQAWMDVQTHHPSTLDTVLGIASSGTTPYVIGGLERAKQHGLTTACLTCNMDTPISKIADFKIEVLTGPEFITGSTRLKAGTATKMVLNMISTTCMIQLGRVEGNQMTHLQLKNNKLIERAINMLIDTLGISRAEASALLDVHKSVHEALKAYRK